MTYAVEGYLDEQSSNRIYPIIQELQANQIPIDLDAKPHITLGIYDQIPVESFQDSLQVFCQTSACCPVHFASIGIFPTPEIVLFFAPVVTALLLAFHERFHKALQMWLPQLIPYYKPAYWVPHSTLGLGLSPQELQQALSLIIPKWEPFHATIDQIGLIQFPPNAQISQYPLQQR